MSHFSVLVITPAKPTNESLSAALQPFHEYECTGVKDQYVVDVDVTGDLENEWAQLVEVVRFPDGTIVNKYDSRFYTRNGEKDFTGSPRKEFELPVGCELIETPRSVLSASEGLSREEYAKQSHGWIFRDGKFFNQTNPNAKWDWWMIGGRFSGKFAPGYDPEKDPNHKETCWLCNGTGTRNDNVVQGTCNSCEGTGFATTWPTQWKGTPGNQIRVSDIPWEALRQAQAKRHVEKYDKAASVTQGMELPRKWEFLRDELGIDAARENYNSYESVKALRKAGFWDESDAIEDLRLTRDEIIARAENRPINCWAILKEGVWYQSGEMGWWGLSTDNKAPNDWNEEVSKLLQGLPPDSWITCVDCHI